MKFGQRTSNVTTKSQGKRFKKIKEGVWGCFKKFILATVHSVEESGGRGEQAVISGKNPEGGQAQGDKGCGPARGK